MSMNAPMTAEQFYFAEPTRCEVGDHEWIECQEQYGADADGNRWEWRSYCRCIDCGEER